MFKLHLLKLFIVSGAFILIGVDSGNAQINQDIWFKYCEARPDDNCFDPILGDIDTVGRDVKDLAQGYRFCLKVDTIDAGLHLCE